MKIFNNHISFLILLFFALSSCKKAEERSCFKSFGSSTTKLVEFDQVDTLELYDDIDLNLIQDSLNYIEVIDFENTIGFIETSNVSNIFSFKNNNKCKVLRSRKKHPLINLHFSSINQIKLFGSGKISSITEWYQDSILIYAEESASTLDLEVKANYIHTYLKNGEIDGSIYGTAASAYCYEGQYSKLILKDLITTSLHIASATTGDIDVYCSDFLHIELWDTGDIIYYGNPKTIYISEDHLTGKLIKGD